MSARAAPTLRWLLLLGLLAAGCGRVGLELRPVPAPEDAADPPFDRGDEGASDAERDGGDLDGGMLEEDASASDAGQDASAAWVDGCVLGDAGGCRACQADAYVSVACGVGYCRGSGTPSRCVGGVEIACIPGTPRSPSDITCDGVDDDCNGQADEDYPGTMTSCGTGACAAEGTLTCASGATVDTCAAKLPMTTADDATGSGNGSDDDCDGRIDEDVSPCDTTPRTFEAGVHANIAVPAGCTQVTVQLWGGAGAAGGSAGIASGALGGRGGSGGYARSTFKLTGPLTLYVGSGGTKEGLSECGPGGVNAGDPQRYSGGRGGTAEGSPGGDGRVAGGGSGASNLFGASGGKGFYGGGGGGEGGAATLDPVNGPGGFGGGGGAASVALLDGMLVMVAGGGGGGGGAAPLVYNFAYDGGNGGEGCGGDGTAGASTRTGGGGGGGVCIGTITSVGSNGRPANAALVPAPRARSSNQHCAPGGDGYAIVTFAR